MSAMRAVIHKPKKEADMWHLLHEISLFRAEKTMKYLQEVKLNPRDITEIIRTSSVTAIRDCEQTTENLVVSQ